MTSVDLRPEFEQLGLALKRQGPRGTCSVFAVTAGLEFEASKRAGRGVRLSEEYLNWAKNEAAHKHQDGDFFHVIWHGYETFGICRLELMPYREAYDPNEEPSPEAREDAKKQLGLAWNWIKPWDVTTGLSPEHVSQIEERLTQDHPVCAGMRWPKQASYTHGKLDMRAPDEVFDGHSVLLVGIDEDADAYLFRDSGAGAYHRLPREYARAYINDAGWISGR